MDASQCTSAPHREPDLALSGTLGALPLDLDNLAAATGTKSNCQHMLSSKGTASLVHIDDKNCYSSKAYLITRVPTLPLHIMLYLPILTCAGVWTYRVQEAGKIRETLWGCSVVVGMHPDQAIEALVDFALCSALESNCAKMRGAKTMSRANDYMGTGGPHKKLFAAVPCCVYSVEFPLRRLPNGRQVTSYDELIQYLVSKDPNRIRTATLPFEGKNKVVYIPPQ
eukprot:994899-Pyramimonas_sp.AAC.1